MKWRQVRLQMLCLGVTAILLMSALSTRLATSVVNDTATQPNPSASLSDMRHRGVLLQKLHEAKVLGSETTAGLPDCVRLHCIALTFDDGPNPVTTPEIVSILEAEHVTATFFMVGSRIAGNEALLRQMVADGDEIGNHSWSHPDLTKLPADQVKQQIDLTQAAITAAGVPAPTLFRPPYEAINQTVRDSVKPLTLALWNEDPKDWAAQTAEEVLKSSEAAAKPGGVIDMHDIYHVTANALQPLLQQLKQRGFRFVTMSQLMGAPTPGGEYYGGYRP